jgi:hypothetical protein
VEHRSDQAQFLNFPCPFPLAGRLSQFPDLRILLLLHRKTYATLLMSRGSSFLHRIRRQCTPIPFWLVSTHVELSVVSRQTWITLPTLPQNESCRRGRPLDQGLKTFPSGLTPRRISWWIRRWRRAVWAIRWLVSFSFFHLEMAN